MPPTTAAAGISEPFDVLLNPHLLVETENETEAETEPGPSAIDRTHRNADWSDGAPAWLRDGDWWGRVRRAHGTSRRRMGRERHPTPVLHGLGSKENYLAEREG